MGWQDAQMWLNQETINGNLSRHRPYQPTALVVKHISMSTKQNRFYNDVIQDYTRIVWLMFSVEIMILLRLSNLIYCLPFWESYAINSTNKVELMICEVRIEQCLNQMLIAKVLYIWSNASHCSPLIGSNGCQTIWHIGANQETRIQELSPDQQQCVDVSGLVWLTPEVLVWVLWWRLANRGFWALMPGYAMRVLLAVDGGVLPLGRWSAGQQSGRSGRSGLTGTVGSVFSVCGVLPHWVLHTRSGKCRQFCGTLLHINPNENDIGTFYLYLAYFERLSKSDTLLLNPGSCLWIKRFN